MPRKTSENEFSVHLGDTIPWLHSQPESCIDEIITSPPFFSVFSYTESPSDLGNTEQVPEAKLHLTWLFRGLLRVLKPGRVMIMHCNQIVNMKRSGGEGITDFRGLLIRLAVRSGWIYEYDWDVAPNPQAQAITTHSHQLQFQGLERDRANSRGALPDIYLKLVKPGVNAVPINSPGQISRNQWIDYAECCWQGLHKSKTLNTKKAKSEKDVRHICPFPLDVVDRFVRLYSNPGELILDPFTGIGTVGVLAIKHDRRFIGAELKPEYHAEAIRNMGVAVRERGQASSMSLTFTDEEDPGSETFPDEPEESAA